MDMHRGPLHADLGTDMDIDLSWGGTKGRYCEKVHNYVHINIVITRDYELSRKYKIS
jgi:hypothetical protein